MPLSFHPEPDTILICDFSTGFRPPEMVKVRPVVVISPRRRSSQLATVVPLSSVEPYPVAPWYWLVPEGLYPSARGPMWAKGDVVTTVALERLDRVKVRDAGGKRRYVTVHLTTVQLAEVQSAVRAALGFT